MNSIQIKKGGMTSYLNIFAIKQIWIKKILIVTFLLGIFSQDIVLLGLSLGSVLTFHVLYQVF